MAETLKNGGTSRFLEVLKVGRYEYDVCDYRSEDIIWDNCTVLQLAAFYRSLYEFISAE